MQPHIDWTINFSDVITMLAFVLSGAMIVWKMHNRLLAVEMWIKLEGEKYDKALAILSSVGDALTRVTTLYESMDKRIDKVEGSIEKHHSDLHLHSVAVGRHEGECDNFQARGE